VRQNTFAADEPLTKFVGGRKEIEERKAKGFEGNGRRGESRNPTRKLAALT